MTIRIFSKPEERLENDLNKSLASVVPIIYGAVFAYSMVVLSDITIHHFSIPFQRNSAVSDLIPRRDYLKMLLVYSLITIYMIDDIGCIIKIESEYPYKRTSRYTMEYFIALLYILSYTFVSIDLRYTILSFSGIMFFCGIWFNNFKEEYPDTKNKIDEYALVQRRWHYAGGSLILIEYIVFYSLSYFHFYSHGENIYALICIFIISTIIWLFLSPLHIAFTNGSNMLKYSVNILIPDFILRMISNWKII